jgi:hypothetical protein
VDLIALIEWRFHFFVKGKQEDRGEDGVGFITPRRP